MVATSIAGAASRGATGLVAVAAPPSPVGHGALAGGHRAAVHGPRAERTQRMALAAVTRQ